jgi:hypothetical protein
MIRLQDYTPDVYYNESRDFQFIGRLYDLLFNYAKTNADLLESLPLSDNSDDQFVELLAYTLGFKPKHKYTSKHLRAICSCLSEIYRNKGTIKAIRLACNAIFNAEGINEELTYELKENSTHLILYLPTKLYDTTLLNDLFDYILPAGLICNTIRLAHLDKDAYTNIAINDNITSIVNTEEETEYATHADANNNLEYQRFVDSRIKK